MLSSFEQSELVHLCGLAAMVGGCAGETVRGASPYQGPPFARCITEIRAESDLPVSTYKPKLEFMFCQGGLRH